MAKALNILLALAIATLVTACKLAVIVVEGGVVASLNSGDCAASAVCIQDINDASYSELYAAIPYNANGWYFQKWNVGESFLCGGSTDKYCRLSFEGHEETPAVKAMVASNETFYLMPVFKKFTDTITVDGKEWYQPYLFKRISWEEINGVCPAGTCTGMLNGYDLTGWKWAGTEDVNALFNYYIVLDGDYDNCVSVTGPTSGREPGSQPLGPGPTRFSCSGVSSSGVTTAWATAFFRDGWRPTYYEWGRFEKSQLGGWMSDQSHPAGITLNEEGAGFQDVASTSEIYNNYHLLAGGWFYRIPRS